MLYSLRDALVNVLDAHDAPVDDVTSVLLTLLAAHAISEGLEGARVIEQLRVQIEVLGAGLDASAES